jgi:hypothetical protein
MSTGLTSSAFWVIVSFLLEMRLHMEFSGNSFTSLLAIHNPQGWSIGPLLSTIVSVAFLVLGLIAVYTMLSIQGREKPSNPGLYRKLHKWAGWLFIVLFIVMFVAMIARMESYWEESSAKIAIHVALAIALLILLLIKTAVPRFFPRLGKYLFSLGITVYVIGFTLVWIAASYYLIGAYRETPYISHAKGDEHMYDIRIGKELFISKCAVCHDLEHIMAPRSVESWEVVVNEMVVLAEPRITPDDAKQILHYLVESHVPVPFEGPADATLIEQHCLPCHDRQEILTKTFTEAGWLEIVKQMNEYDPEIVPEGKFQQIVSELLEYQEM